MTTDLLHTANDWLNQQSFNQAMMVLPESLQEHAYCYSFNWCAVAQKDWDWTQRSIWVGSGRLLISKDGRLVDFEGSAPGVDWVHHFELRVRGLEGFWHLEIFYHKQYLSRLKTALQCSTSELLHQLTPDQSIVRTAPRTWLDQQPSFQALVDDLNDFGIPYQLEARSRPLGHGLPPTTSS